MKAPANSEITSTMSLFFFLLKSLNEMMPLLWSVSLFKESGKDDLVCTLINLFRT